MLMKGTKVQTVGALYACARLINDGPGHATLSTTYLSAHRLANCVVVSWFRAVLDLDTYPLSNLIRPCCAERGKPSRGKPMLIMRLGFFACFHAISLERSCFSKIPTLVFHALVALKLLVSLLSHLVACSARIIVDRQTDRQTRQTDRQTHRHTGQLL